MAGKTLIQSIDRAVEVLEIVMNAKGPVRSSEIAARMGLEPRTAHNIVRSLYLHGLLTQDGESRYLLGPMCFKFAGAARKPFEMLGQACREPVLELARRTGNTTFFGCEYYGALYCVALAHESGSWEINGRQDWLNTIHATAAGKIIIAEKGLPWFAEICRREKLTVFTEQTITSADGMAPELEKIGRDGYALCVNEHLRGVAAIGVAVRQKDGGFLGALVQSFPDYFLEIGRIVASERAELLKQAARRIAEAAGESGK